MNVSFGARPVITLNFEGKQKQQKEQALQNQQAQYPQGAANNT